MKSMNHLSRREFLSKTASLAAAFPFMEFGTQSDTALKRGSRVEDLAFSSAFDVAKAIAKLKEKCI